MAKSKDTPTTRQKVLREVKSLSLILVVVLAIRSVFFEPFRIPSGSMIPTLMIGDFILVNKLAYGVKVPFSDISFSSLGIDFNPIYLFAKDSPKRGDVVVFKFPKDPSINYIKRVVGVPGDTVEVKNKVVHINGRPLEREQISKERYMEDMDDKFKDRNLSFYKIKPGGGQEFVIQQDDDNVFRVDHEKLIVPPGKYFVMGDNRDASYDSRYWGFVSHKHIKGKALFVWFSMIFPFSSDSFKFRYWRIGTKVR